MREIGDLLRAELLKIGRRRLTWVLLFLLMAVQVLHVRSLNTSRLDYRAARESGVGRFGQSLPPEAAQAVEAEFVRRMQLPGFLDGLWGVTEGGGVFALL